MTDLTLRSKLIRLAYRKPELRSDLIPLLTRTAGDDDAPLTPKEVKGVTTHILYYFNRGDSANFKKAVEIWKKHEHELDSAKIYKDLATKVLGAHKEWGSKPPAHMKFSDWGQALKKFVEFMGGLDHFQDTSDLHAQFFDQ